MTLRRTVCARTQITHVHRPETSSGIIDECNWFTENSQHANFRTPSEKVDNRVVPLLSPFRDAYLDTERPLDVNSRFYFPGSLPLSSYLFFFLCLTTLPSVYFLMFVITIIVYFYYTGYLTNFGTICEGRTGKIGQRNALLFCKQSRQILSY